MVTQSVHNQLLMFVAGYFVLLVCVLVAASRRGNDNARRRKDGVIFPARSGFRVRWGIRKPQTALHVPEWRLTPKPCAVSEAADAFAGEYTDRFCKQIRFFL